MTIKRRTPRPETAPKAPARKKAPKTNINHGSTTAMREKFYVEYLVDRNGTQAAIRAGASPHSAHATASRWLKRADIRGRLKSHDTEVLQHMADQYEISPERIARELALLGFSNMSDYGTPATDGGFDVDLTAASRDQMAALHTVKTKRTVRTIGDMDVEEVTTEIKLSDKRQALMDLARLQGYTKDEGAIGGNVTFNVIWNPGLPGPTPYEDEEAA